MWRVTGFSLFAAVATVSLAWPQMSYRLRWPCFTAQKSGVAACYPPGWFVLDRTAGAFEIVNFPPERRVKAVVLPDGGASIAVIREPAAMASIEDWIQQRTRSVKPDRRRAIPVHTRTGQMLNVIEVDYHWTTAGVTERYVDAYFGVNNVEFCGGLTYWAGDPHAKDYRNVLLGVVATVRSAK